MDILFYINKLYVYLLSFFNAFERKSLWYVIANLCASIDYHNHHGSSTGSSVAFFKNFERGTWHDDIYTYVAYWYDYLIGGVVPPTPPTPPTPTPPEQDETMAMYIVGLILKWFQ